MTHRIPNVRLLPTDHGPNYGSDQETWVSLLIGRSLIVGIGGGMIALGLWTAWKVGSMFFG